MFGKEFIKITSGLKHDAAAEQAKSDARAKALKKLDSLDVLVGIPQEANAAHAGGITNAELAYIHTHGVRRQAMQQEMSKSILSGKKYSKAHELYIQEHGSPLWQSPPRPIIEPAINAHKEEIGLLLKAAMEAALEGSESGVTQNLKKAGMMGQNVVRDWFEDPANGWPPNNPETVKRKKGKENPLIDTGALRKSITYVVREK